MGDPGVPQAREVANHGAGAAVVVDVDRVERGAFDPAVEQDDGKCPRQVGLENPRVGLRRHHHQPVDPAAQGAQHGLDLAAVAVRAGDQNVEAVMPRRQVDAADDLGEELTIEVREEDTHGARLLGDQAARHRMRRVAEPSGDFQDALAGLLPDGSLLVEHPGHRGDRDPGSTGNLLDRGAHGRRTPRRLVQAEECRSGRGSHRPQAM
jgi:hypothetical protein